MSAFKPMLADRLEDLTKLQLPAYVSPKLDGVRAIVIDGVVYSRSLKPIPSRFVQEHFGHLNGFDGELIAGVPTDPECFRLTMSRVMTKGGSDPVDFHVFDHVRAPLDPWFERYARLMNANNSLVKPVQHYFVNSVDFLAQLEEQFLADGYEGAMVRSPHAPYKYGRSTVREGHLLKLKRFMDSEAVVVGVQELMHNANELQKDELGYAKRTTHQENMVPLGVLGALEVQDLETGVHFNIGTGFTMDERKSLWGQVLLNRIVKYRFFPTGSKDKPRFPVFAGFREEIDL